MADLLSLSFNLRFDEALKIARDRKVVLPSTYYGEIPDAARRLAWTVSNIAGLDQIQNVFDSLNAAIADGKTLAEWRSASRETNWNLPPARLDLLYRAQVQTAYMGGYVRKFDDNKDTRPYLMYSAINDARTRPAHRAMSGQIAAVDDPLWNTWTPPCGFNCRCSLVSLTKQGAEDRGLNSQTRPSVEPDPGWGFAPAQAQQAMNTFLDQAVYTAPVVVANQLTDNIANSPPLLASDIADELGDDYDALMAAVIDVNDGRLQYMGQEDAVALRAYLGEYSYRMNEILRGIGGGRELAYEATISGVTQGLAQLDPYQGTYVYRGVSSRGFPSSALFDSWLEAHTTPGNIIEWAGFTSASKLPTGIAPGDITLVIRQLTGRDVLWLSPYPNEAEVLLPPGAVVKVRGAELRDGRWIIYVDEVSKDTPTTGHTFAAGTDDEAKRVIQETLDLIDPKARPNRAMIEKMTQEAVADPKVMAAYKATHDGKTPLQVIAEKYPQLAEALKKIASGK